MPHLYLILLLATVLPLATAQENRGYIFVAPKRLYSGTNATFCFHFKNIRDTDAEIKIKLLKGRDDNTEVAAEHHHHITVESGVWQCLHDFPVPWKARFSYFPTDLNIHVNFPGLADNFTIDESKAIDWTVEDDLFFIETDKDKYKLGQKVYLRILKLDKHLKPLTDPIKEVWIEDPHNDRMAQWREVSMDRGLIQLEYQLSEEPPEGRWKIFAILDENLGGPGPPHIMRHYFTVEKYSLPKFSVSITPESKFIAKTDQNFTWTICAKYTHGQPVVGHFRVRVVSLSYHFWGRPILNLLPDPFITEMPFSGCENFTYDMESFNLTESYVNSIEVFATVKEKGTGIEHNTTEYTSVKKESIDVEFKDYDRHYFKPGLYNFDTLVLHEKSSNPHLKEDMTVCIKYLNKTFPCQNLKADKKGVMKLQIAPLPELESDNTTKVELEYLVTFPSINFTKSLTRKVWFSPSYNFIKLSLPWDKPVQCNKVHSFHLHYSPVQEDTTANVMIISKSEIVRSFPIVLSLNDEIAQPDSGITLFNVGEHMASPVSLFKSFDVIITPDLSDRFTMLIHYIRDDSEVVSDSLEVEVENCHQNQVLMKWNRGRPSPGSDIDLTIRAAPHSLCAVSVVDKSVKLLSSKDQIELEEIQRRRRYYHLSSFNSPYQVRDGPYCSGGLDFWGGRRKKRSYYFRELTHQADAIFAFDNAGLVVMSDMTLESRPCISSSLITPIMDIEYDSTSMDRSHYSPRRGPRVRKYFPETWLFKLQDFGNKGLIRRSFKVPDSITEWIGSTYCVSPHEGFGMSEVSSFIAFSHFFLDYTMPVSVKRGETFPLKVSIFNYADQKLPIKLELDKTEEFDVVDDDHMRKFWLLTQENKVLVFNVTATKIGSIKIKTQAFVSPDEELGSAGDIGPLIYLSDAIEKTLLVEAEGFPEELFHSKYVCVEGGASERHSLSCIPPPNTVPDSSRAKFSVTGSLMGSVLKNLDRLIVLPYGCGEQNMATLVPNIHALAYLNSMNSDDENLKKKCISHMQEGYQRQLKYKHNDGSYSAFGQKDEIGSLWLTAFVLKSFSQASSYTYIDEKILRKARAFVVSKQLDSGCFPKVGKVFSKSLKGGLGDGSPTLLTAYVVTSLLVGGEDPYGTVVENSLKCLHPENIPREPYAEAITAYAWMLAYRRGREGGLSIEKNKRRILMGLELLKRLQSTRQMEWGTIFWKVPDCSWCSAIQVETAGYALLAHMIATPTDYDTLRGIAKYLIKEKNFYGSYYSTQDTVIAVEALSKVTLMFEDVPLKEVHVSSSVGKFVVTKENKLLNQETSTGSEFQQKFVVQGTGCALVQCSLKYNTIIPEDSPAFSLKVTSKGESPDGCGNRRLDICVQYQLEDLQSNMAVIEISLASGYSVDEGSLKILENDDLKKWEQEGNKVNLYYDYFTDLPKCISVDIVQKIKVENTKPGSIRVYDYYQPQYLNSQSYNVCDDDDR